MQCGLDSYDVGFLVKELGKCVVDSDGRGGNDAVMGSLHLDFTLNDINGSGVRLICELVSKASVIKSLKLGYNRIQESEDGLLCLLHMLCNNGWLDKVDLMACNLRINAENGRVLVEMLSTNFALTELKLNGNGEIGDSGMGYIAEGMSANTGVLRLNLDTCGIGEVGCKFLGRTLIDNKTLNHLVLRDNEIGNIGVGYIADGMSANSGVSRLSLEACGIGEQGGKSLGRMLSKNRTLKELNLSWNERLGGIGIMAVSEGLRVNCGLEELDIWACGYSLDCLKEFVLCLEENSRLRRLTVDKEKNVEEERAAVNELRRQHGVVEPINIIGLPTEESECD